MKHLLNALLFAMGVVLASGAMAATGTGEAQAELSTPLAVSNTTNVNFGTIAIDPAAGEQTIALRYNVSGIICPATYVCSGTAAKGILTVSGRRNANIFVSLIGQTATLSDGNGNTLIFDPELNNGQDSWAMWITAGGTLGLGISGTITFTGNEPAGTYNTTNAGGSGYVINVIYN